MNSLNTFSHFSQQPIITVPADIITGLVNWYTFAPSDIDGSGKCLNHATSIYDATMKSATINTSVIKKGTGSLYSNETTKLTCFTMPPITVTSAGFSISAWYMFNNTVGFTRGCQFSQNYNYNFGIFTIGNQIGFATNSTHPYFSPFAISTWYHVVATFDGNNTCKLYVNGNLSSTVASKIQIGTHPDCLIAATMESTVAYNTYTSDFRTYNLCLTPNQVNTLYNF